jgi:hypothetical protein
MWQGAKVKTNFGQLIQNLGQSEADDIQRIFGQLDETLNSLIDGGVGFYLS